MPFPPEPAFPPCPEPAVPPAPFVGHGTSPTVQTTPLIAGSQ
jgi:hypothetical protein